MIGAGQQPREAVREARTGGQAEPEAHAPKMSRYASHTGEATGQDDPGIADHRGGQHGRKCINCNEHRAFERHSAREQGGQACRQLKRQNCKGHAKTEGHEEGELLEEPGAALCRPVKSSVADRPVETVTTGSCRATKLCARHATPADSSCGPRAEIRVPTKRSSKPIKADVPPSRNSSLFTKDYW